MFKSVLLPSLLLFGVVINDGQPQSAEQPSYSESAPYRPTKFTEPPGKKKKSSDREPKPAVAAGQRAPNVNRSFSMPVSILDRAGNHRGGLQKTDFSVYIDDREAEFAIENNGGEPLTFIMLIDTSPSTQFSIEEIRDYVLKIVENFAPDDRVLIAGFDQNLKIVHELSVNRQNVKKAVRRLKTGDGTSIYDSLTELYRQHIASIDGRKALIVFTDGVDTTSQKTTVAESLAVAERFDAPVYSVYFDTFKDMRRQPVPQLLSIPRGRITAGRPAGSEEAEYKIGRAFLNDLMYLSGGRIFQTADKDTTPEAIAQSIGEEMRARYYLRVNASGPYKSGARLGIKVRVNQPALMIFARGSVIFDEEIVDDRR